MAAEILCPICGATYNVAEAQLGKKVRCKKCEHPFTATSSKGNRRRSEDDEDEDTRPAARGSRRREDSDDEGIQDSPRPKPARAAKRVDEDDEDDDEDRPRRGARSTKGGGFPWVPVLIGGGVLFMLVLVGVVVLIAIGFSEDESGPNAAGPVPPGVNFVPKGNVKGIPNPGVPGNPAEGELRNPFRAAPQLGGIDDAIKLLASNEAIQRQDGARWLAQAPVDAGRRAEVGKALIPLLAATENEHVRNIAVTAAKPWGTTENVPHLVSYLEKNKGNIFTKDQRVAGMQALARIKDERGASVIASELLDFHVGSEAKAALREFGSQAERAVAAVFFTPDIHGNPNPAAGELLQAYGTKDEVILTVALELLAGPDQKQHIPTLNWLGKTKVVEAKRAEVSKALSGFLQSGDNKVADAAVRAAGIWGGEESVTALVAYLDRNRANHGARETRSLVMRALARIKDERGAEAIAADLPDFFVGEDARSALREFGPKAEKAVAKYLFHGNDPFGKVQQAADDLLRGYGSKSDVAIAGGLQALRTTTDDRQRDRVVAWFEKATPTGASNEEVSRAITELLDNPERKIKTAAAKVARTWGSKDNVPSLIRALEDDHIFARDMRVAAMQALARLKDERGVVPVILQTGNIHNKNEATEALRSFGPVVEKALVKLLSDPNPNTRVTVWQLMGTFGTQASAEQAKAALAKETDRRIKGIATVSMAQMNSRPAPKE